MSLFHRHRWVDTESEKIERQSCACGARRIRVEDRWEYSGRRRSPWWLWLALGTLAVLGSLVTEGGPRGRLQLNPEVRESLELTMKHLMMHQGLVLIHDGAGEN